MPSDVAHPSHYNFGKIEVIEFLEDQKLSFHRANAVKYVCRAGRKNPEREVEDLEKAVWYLKRDIENLKAAREGRDPARPNDMNPKKPLLTIFCRSMIRHRADIGYFFSPHDKDQILLQHQHGISGRVTFEENPEEK